MARKVTADVVERRYNPAEDPGAGGMDESREETLVREACTWARGKLDEVYVRLAEASEALDAYVCGRGSNDRAADDLRREVDAALRQLDELTCWAGATGRGL